ncbi:DUF5776 domain-containing protein [Levilactobacillus tongjiangensis]|uniref:DUF5776 domain-containing protein n=1 Tax=Levilactobacillus tongjiangensis TaxID=2486023 RepID=A0ABW1SRA4_9LACO|nr:DUF5776 domain-containing protein [Levilactobacillus tongjiangensis]
MLFSATLLTAGVAVQTNATASSTDTPTTGTATATNTIDATHGIVDGAHTVWADLPAGSVAILASAANGIPTYDDHGVQNGTTPGPNAQIVTKIAVNLEPDNTDSLLLQLQGNPTQWIKLNSKVSIYIGGSSDELYSTGGKSPINFTVNFVDQNDKAIQNPLIVPIDSYLGEDDPNSHVNDSIKTAMTSIRDDLPQMTYSIDGYTPRATDPVTTDGDYTTTFHYVSKETPVNPDTPGGNTGNNTSNTTNTDSNSSSSSSESSSADQSANQPAPVKNKAVYATKAIGLYKTPTFTKANRQHFYSKQSRINRPKFIVTGYARSKNGVLRYRVRDVHNAKLTGYITANSAYVTNTYYQSNPKTIKVLSRHGINAYSQASLKGKALKHYARGTSLKIKAVKSYHLTNRFVLPNGHYISANKTLVIKK